MFCVDCDRPICMRCAQVTEHQKHEREELSTAAKRVREELHPLLEKARLVGDTYEEQAAKLDQLHREIYDKHDQQAALLRAAFQAVRNVLQTREDHLLAELSAVGESRRKAVVDQAENLRYVLVRPARTMCDAVQKMLAQADGACVLDRQAAIRAQLDAIVAQLPAAQSVVPVSDADFGVQCAENIVGLVREYGAVKQSSLSALAPQRIFEETYDEYLARVCRARS